MLSSEVYRNNFTQQPDVKQESENQYSEGIFNSLNLLFLNQSFDVQRKKFDHTGSREYVLRRSDDLWVPAKAILLKNIFF